MFAQLLTIGLLMTLAVILPGPDVAIVTKNSILYSRRAGLFTSFGISFANLIHITYCVLGLAIIISQSLLFFSIIKYIGATYLIYLGVKAILAKSIDSIGSTSANKLKKKQLADVAAFKQGFLCNLLNPKATLFYLALFTVIIKPQTSLLWQLAYAIEMFIIIITWFCSLTIILSHPRILKLLNKVEKYIEKTLGVFLIGFGVALAFIRK